MLIIINFVGIIVVIMEILKTAMRVENAILSAWPSELPQVASVDTVSLVSQPTEDTDYEGLSPTTSIILAAVIAGGAIASAIAKRRR
jgi:capsular polysaccharide biosynthesis protein